MSIHPALSLLASRPDLVLAHAAGYAALMQEEATDVAQAAARRAAAWVALALLLAAFLTLAGVAAMLGVMLAQFHWVLLAAPGAVLALAAIACAVARKPLAGDAFAQLKAQIDADAQLLRRATVRQ